MAVADPKQKKTFGLFSSKKKRGASGTAPKSPHGGRFESSDFDRMLIHRDRTKKLILSSRSDTPNTTIWHLAPTTDLNSRLAATLPRTPGGGGGGSRGGGPLSPLKRDDQTCRRTRSSGKHGNDVTEDDAMIYEGKVSFFASIKNKERAIRRVKTDESTRDKFKRDKERQKEREFEFELQSASGLSSPDDPKDKREKRKANKEDEKWMGEFISQTSRSLACRACDCRLELMACLQTYSLRMELDGWIDKTLLHSNLRLLVPVHQARSPYQPIHYVNTLPALRPYHKTLTHTPRHAHPAEAGDTAVHKTKLLYTPHTAPRPPDPSIPTKL